MRKRREARERAVQFLFQFDMNPAEDLESALNTFWDNTRLNAALDARGPTWGEKVELPAPTAEALTWVPPSVRRLEASKPPERPFHGLVHPALLLGGTQEVQLLHELKAELASADRVQRVIGEHGGGRRRCRSRARSALMENEFTTRKIFSDL